MPKNILVLFILCNYGEEQTISVFLSIQILIRNKSWLDYNSLCIYGNSLHQPEYKLLKDAFGKGYEKSDILNFLQNSRGDIEKFICELPRKSHKRKTIFTSYDSSDILPDPKDIN